MIDDDKILPADVPTNVIDDLNDILDQEALWQTCGGSSITAGDRSVISPALAQLSKTVFTFGSKLADLARGPVDNVETSRAATTKAEKEIEIQKRLVAAAQKSANTDFNDVVSFCELVTVSGTHKALLLSSASVASAQIGGATAEIS